MCITDLRFNYRDFDKTNQIDDRLLRVGSLPERVKRKEIIYKKQ